MWGCSYCNMANDDKFVSCQNPNCSSKGSGRSHPDHVLYKQGDTDAPEQIKDSNGDVVLGQCRLCGRAEIDLQEPCDRRLKQKQLDPMGPVFVRARLSDFAHVMEVKLRKNDHKTEWTKMPLQLLLKRLQGEVIELEVAIDYESPQDAMKEAADVANFAFFIYDRIRTELESGKRKSGEHKGITT